MICENGDKIWYLNGQRHRTDGPVIERADGTKEWRLNGERHRIDGPAVEYPDGHKAWYLNGVPHREDGPAIEFTGGYKTWYLYGKGYLSKAAWIKAKLDQGLISKEDAFIEALCE